MKKNQTQHFAQLTIALALLSMSLIAMETVWTRIFSAAYFYTFAFLIISLSMLGMGLGALTLHNCKKLQNTRYLPVIMWLTGLFMATGPLLVAQLNLNFSTLLSTWLMPLKLITAIILLSAPYFTGGMAIALIFRNHSQRISTIYFADLGGAALGVIAAVFMMNYFETDRAATLIGIPSFIAALLLSRRYLKIIPALLIVFTLIISQTLTQHITPQKTDSAPVIYSHWDAMSKIKIFQYDENYYGINIDNAANTTVYHFDGNWNRPDSLRFGFGINLSDLIHRFPSCTFLSLGAGGGTDVLQALQEGATEIHAVEVNQHINQLMTTGMLNDFSGNIYHDPRVKVITDDARAYVRNFHNKFDIIFSLSSNSFAALASGSFALAENYLFTTEAFEDYYSALSENGYLVMEHQFYLPRIATMAMEALKREGIARPQDHLAIYSLPGMRRQMLLMGKSPLNRENIQNTFGELTAENFNNIHLLYPAADSLQNNTIQQIITHGWQNTQQHTAIDLSPCTDNQPFCAQLGRWDNLSLSGNKKLLPYEFYGFPLSLLIIGFILLVIILLVIPLCLIPYFSKRHHLPANLWLYFFTIGLAYISIEVMLMQHYTRFIGPSSYTFMTILFTLLLGSGAGSLTHRHFSKNGAFTGIIVLLLINTFLSAPLFSLATTLPMTGRIILTVIMLLPLGYFMGMPFPKGIEKAGEQSDWAFAVNGAAAVAGSATIMLIAFNFGFTIALFIATVCYAGAWLLLRRA